MTALRKAAGAQFGGRGVAPFKNTPNMVDSVQVVGVTGDLSVAERAMRAVFKGNLCVVHADATEAASLRQTKQIVRALDGDKFTKDLVLSVGNSVGVTVPLGNPRTHVYVAYVTNDVLRAIRSVSGPRVIIDVWLEPIGH